MNLKRVVCFLFIALVQIAGNCFETASCSDEKSKSAQTTLSLSEAIRLLEASVCINPAQEGSAEQRIAALENKLLGATQSGGLIARVERLKRLNEARQDKGGAETALKRTSETKLRAKDPQVGRALKYLPLKDETSVNFVRMEQSGNKEEASGDYFSTIMVATKHKIMRFKQMPVPVYIAPGPERLFTRACINGFEIWEERAGGIVRFVQVDDPHTARIRVTWNHSGNGGSRGDCNVGARTITKWTDDNAPSSALSIGGIPLSLLGTSTKYVAPPQVIEVNLDFIYAKPEEVRMRILQNVIAHELGHALGILTHSPDPGDLMYAVSDEHSRLSQRDINTLKKLYESKVDVAL